MMDFTGKTVMVTGAAGTVGRAVASAFGSRGARLVLADIRRNLLLDAYAGDAEHSANDILFLAVDLLDSGALSTQLDQVPRIDVLCNVAGGFAMGTPVHETDDRAWLRMLDLNASTVLSASRAVVPRMLAQGSGWIVNVGAGAALRGAAHMGAYAASKSAVLRLTESMSAELRDRDIHVNCVLPSIIDTPQNRRDMPDADFDRWVSPASLAEVMVFLASPASRAVHGACIPVSGLV